LILVIGIVGSIGSYHYGKTHAIGNGYYRYWAGKALNCSQPTTRRAYYLKDKNGAWFTCQELGGKYTDLGVTNYFWARKQYGDCYYVPEVYLAGEVGSGDYVWEPNLPVPC
jgi:hypothetical protein